MEVEGGSHNPEEERSQSGREEPEEEENAELIVGRAIEGSLTVSQLDQMWLDGGWKTGYEWPIRAGLNKKVREEEVGIAKSDRIGMSFEHMEPEQKNHRAIREVRLTFLRVLRDHTEHLAQLGNTLARAQERGMVKDALDRLDEYARSVGPGVGTLMAEMAHLWAEARGREEEKKS